MAERRIGSLLRRTPCIGGIVGAAVIGASAAAFAAEPSFETLLAPSTGDLGAECRNGIVAHRIEKWRRRDQPASNAFPSVQAIMDDVSPPALDALKAKGCDDRYIWGFLSCTGVDWPENASPNIRPIGVVADTEAAMATHMRNCMTKLEAGGVLPAKSWIERLIDDFAR